MGIFIVLGIILVLVIGLPNALKQMNNEQREYGKPILKWNYSDSTEVLMINDKSVTFADVKSFKYEASDTCAFVEYKTGEKCRLSVPINGQFKQLALRLAQIKEEEEKKAIEEAKRKAEQERIHKVVDFAKNYGVDLFQAYQEKSKYLNIAMRNLSISAMPTYMPNYTRGVVSGSLGDSISVLTNAQKKKNYEEMVTWKNNCHSEGISAKYDYSSKAKEIIARLKEIPNSEEYVEYEEREYSHNMSILNEFR